MDYFYKQPRYFLKFSCVGGKCPVSCCDKWGVIWEPDEYKRLAQAQTSEELGGLINSNFEYSEKNDHYTVRLCEDGRCPFHERGTDLCAIQKELGEQYLGITCGKYPRCYYKYGNDIIRFCSGSCPAVIKLLINDKNAAELEMMPARDILSLDLRLLKMNTEKIIERSPYAKYRRTILEFYVGLFGKKGGIENMIILGALAAKKISDASENGEADTIPKLTENLRKQYNSPAAAKSADSIDANPTLKFLLVSNLMSELTSRGELPIDISVLHDGEKLITERYLQGKASFEKAFENRSYAIKNIAVNMFMDIFLYRDLTELSFFSFYSYFTLCIAAVQIFAYTAGYTGGDIEDTLIKTIAVLNREISHNKAKPLRVLDRMRSAGLTSPAHLAIIIK